MVIVRLIGGLGNQLFQYSAGRALAARLGTELVLDTTWYDGPFLFDTPRTFSLGSFNVRARPPTPREVRWLRLYNNRLLSRIPLPRPWRHVRESHFHYDSSVETLDDNVYLSGYWQSPRYFENLREELVADIRPRGLEPTEWRDQLRSVRAVESIALHVRRGDYVSHAPASSVHGTLPLSYYGEAVDFTLSRVRKPATVFVFSDDRDWARENMRLPCEVHMVPSLSRDPAWELMLMSQCRHNVIANSSFSWWGAWLNPAPGKVVIAPKQWFRDPAIRTSDLIPTDWHRL